MRYFNQLRTLVICIITLINSGCATFMLAGSDLRTNTTKDLINTSIRANTTEQKAIRFNHYVIKSTDDKNKLEDLLGNDFYAWVGEENTLLFKLNQPENEVLKSFLNIQNKYEASEESIPTFFAVGISKPIALSTSKSKKDSLNLQRFEFSSYLGLEATFACYDQAELNQVKDILLKRDFEVQKASPKDYLRGLDFVFKLDSKKNITSNINKNCNSVDEISNVFNKKLTDMATVSKGYSYIQDDERYYRIYAPFKVTSYYETGRQLPIQGVYLTTKDFNSLGFKESSTSKIYERYQVINMDKVKSHRLASFQAHSGKAAWLIAMPFAVAADIVTSPIQMIVGAYFLNEVKGFRYP